MRAIIVIIIICASFFDSYAQITLENSYTRIPLRRSNNEAHFYLSEIDDGVFKYIYFDDNLGFLKLYHLNHTLYKNITLPAGRLTGLTPFSNIQPTCLYVSRTLFDCDSTNIEYMITSDNVTSGFQNAVEIYRENGDTVFMKKHAGLAVTNELHLKLPGIYKTPSGTKMIIESYRWTQLSNIFDTLQVYSLCGNLPTNIFPNPSIESSNISTKAYPNPTSEVLTIEYELEEGDQGSLHIFDANGSVLKQYNIDAFFDNIQLNLEEEGLKSGLYFYTITTEDGKQLTKKFIKIP